MMLIMQSSRSVSDCYPGVARAEPSMKVITLERINTTIHQQMLRKIVVIVT